MLATLSTGHNTSSETIAAGNQGCVLLPVNPTCRRNVVLFRFTLSHCNFDRFHLSHPVPCDGNQESCQSAIFQPTVN